MFSVSLVLADLLQMTFRMKLLLRAIIPLMLTATAAGQNRQFEKAMNSGREAFRAANYAEAERYLRSAVDIAEATKASDTDKSAALSDLAHALLGQDRLAESEKLFERALEIVRSSPTVDRRRIPLVLNNLGALYRLTERYVRSESLLTEARKLTEQELGPEHAPMASVLNNLGVLYLMTNRRKLAEATLKQALVLSEKEVVPDYPDNALILNNLAALYMRKKKWDLAEPLLRRALQIIETQLSPEHPDAAFTLISLGLVYEGRNKLVESEKALRRALHIHRKVSRAGSPGIAVAGSNLANVLTAQGHYIEAQTLYVESLGILDENPEQRELDAPTVMEMFARLLRLRGNEEAKAMEARAKSIRTRLGYTVPAQGR